jgi:hypothetical protein
VKKIQFLICFLFLALSTLTLCAQTQKRPRIVHTTERSATRVPPQEVPAGLQQIYSNLSTKTDLYNDLDGWSIEGPAVNGYSFFAAIPFTPKSNSHVLQVRAAVHHYNGANQVNLSIYGDAGGVPGSLLAGPVTVRNLPDGGTCCALAIANFTPLAVTGGSQYWVVVDTPLTGTGSDFLGVWDMVAKVVPLAFNGDNSGWYASSANDLPAGAVLGTIP